MVQGECIATPLSTKERKVITSLRLSKRRKEEGLFIAEGVKGIELLLRKFTPRWIVISENSSELIKYFDKAYASKIRTASHQVMKSISQLESRQEVIAVLEYDNQKEHTIENKKNISIALDTVQNPGNIGTIIRLCDWLGISTLILGKGCADPFGAKAVQASMGALANVTIIQEVDLNTYLPKHFRHIIATTLDGEDYRLFIPQSLKDSVLLFGNEGSGISPQLLSIANQYIAIPKATGSVSDSLNVSLSAAILLSSFVQ